MSSLNCRTLIGLLCISTQVAAHFRVDRSRRKSNDPDSTRPIQRRQFDRQRIEPALAGDVGRRNAGRLPRHHARHVDDHAAPPPFHVLRRPAGQKRRHRQTNAKRILPGFHRNAAHGHQLAGRRIVHEHVDPPKLADRSIDGGLCEFKIRQVAGDRNGGSARGRDVSRDLVKHLARLGHQRNAVLRCQPSAARSPRRYRVMHPSRALLADPSCVRLREVDHDCQAVSHRDARQ